MDYVVTNNGLNTKYHVSKGRPLRLYFDDFDRNSTLDLIEAEFEGDQEYPVRGRSYSSRCMPFIAKKYKTFHDYSLASIADIYDTQSSARLVLEANTLQNTLLVNRGGNNGFEIKSLHRLSNISPAFGIQSADIDRDGHLDLIIANNFYSAQPETRYMDGGVSWLLKGNGGASFAPIWPDQSGISILDDANGVAIADTDLDGDMDVVVAVNDGQMRFLENQTNRPFTKTDQTNLRVKGPLRNQRAIGARILVTNGQGKKQVFEIGASGGCCAQNANHCIALSNDALKDGGGISVFWPDGTSTQRANFSLGTTIEIEHGEQHVQE